MKFLISYYEDEYSCVAEAIIECKSEGELENLVDKYYETNLKHLNIAGAKWSKTNE